MKALTILAMLLTITVASAQTTKGGGNSSEAPTAIAEVPQPSQPQQQTNVSPCDNPASKEATQLWIMQNLGGLESKTGGVAQYSYSFDNENMTLFEIGYNIEANAYIDTQTITILPIRTLEWSVTPNKKGNKYLLVLKTIGIKIQDVYKYPDDFVGITAKSTRATIFSQWNAGNYCAINIHKKAEIESINKALSHLKCLYGGVVETAKF